MAEKKLRKKCYIMVVLYIIFHMDFLWVFTIFHSGMEIISPFSGELGPAASVGFCCTALEACNCQ